MAYLGRCSLVVHGGAGARPNGVGLRALALIDFEFTRVWFIFTPMTHAHDQATPTTIRCWCAAALDLPSLSLRLLRASA